MSTDLSKVTLGDVENFIFHLTEEFKPPSGAKHSLTLDEHGHLQINVWHDSKCYPVQLDTHEEWLNPEETVAELRQVVS